MLGHEEFKTEYNSLLKAAGLEKYADKIEGMYNICESLDEANRQFNLTAIRDGHDMLNKHIIDSLIVLNCIEGYFTEGKLIDIGSGAGFPSLPVAAASKLDVTAIDSTTKKINYINETAENIGINNIKALSCRAEDFSRGEARESFDVACARAVARLPILIELCAPFVKVGGIFVAIKGESAPEEINDSEKGAKTLGLNLEKIYPYTLPTLEDKRYLLVYKKIKATDKKYPRNYSQISKKPL